MDLKELREIELHFVADPDFSLTESQTRDLIYLSKKALSVWKVLTGLETMDHAEVVRELQRKGQLPPVL